MKPITEELLARCRKGYEEDTHAQTLTAAAAKTEYADLAFQPLAAAKLSGRFSVELKNRGVTAQRQSGRCWMFAVMNMLREKAADRMNVEAFTLSGNYLAFYDKLEKANNFLEMVIENAGLPLNDRKMEYILTGFGDGGYWNMAVDLVKKYGVVPSEVMPETHQSEHTAVFTKVTRSLLRKDAAELRRMIAAGEDVTARKEEMVAEIYKAQCIAFGEPPQTFDFSWRDKDDVFHECRNLTPKRFYEEFIGVDLDDYVTVTNHPTPGLPMNLHYFFHYTGSMAEGNVYNLNLTMDELEDLCVKQLKAGEPVWFGCDSGAYGSRSDGVWDPASLDYEGLMGGVDLTMTKSDRLQYHDSYATHAMILIGVNFDENGRPERWKIENSWGEENGKKGLFVCSEAYFREFVYEGIIRRDLLSDAQRALLEKPPVEINGWESDTL